MLSQSLAWVGENNWLFPPPYLVPRVLQRMAEGWEDGTLIVPEIVDYKARIMATLR